MDSNARKTRKRKEPSEYSLPEIPGVPVDVIPSFVEALRTATKYFQKETNKPYGLTTSDEMSNETSADGTSGTAGTATSLLHDSIMARLDAAAETPEEVERRVDHKKRHDDMTTSIERWLDQVKRFVPKKNYYSSSSSSTIRPSIEDEEQPSSSSSSDQQQGRKRGTISVPAACFLYVWGIQQDHPRVAVRRAALFLSAHLLERSKDCRHYLDQDNNLSAWITAISDHGTTVWNNPESAAKHLPLFQKEAMMLLSRLVDRGYAAIYPKLDVAAHRMRQRCPQQQLESLESTGISNMADWRRWRDAALCYGQKEIQRLEKLVSIGHQCLEILVPRVGYPLSSSSSPASSPLEPKAESTKGSHVGKDDRGDRADEGNDDDDDDDDDIDWEDGDGFEDEDTSLAAAFHADNNEHFDAVERTLAAMESCGGLRGGEMEINFGNSRAAAPTVAVTGVALDDTEQPSSTVASEAATVAASNPELMKRLQKCLRSLSGRHVPRISMWLDGLTNADNLVYKGGALVSLQNETSQLRGQLVDKLMEYKMSIASLISSTTRLSIDMARGDGERNDDPATHQTRQTNSSTIRLGFQNRQQQQQQPTIGRQSLVSSLQRQQKRKKGRRPNRIEIKFRTS